MRPARVGTGSYRLVLWPLLIKFFFFFFTTDPFVRYIYFPFEAVTFQVYEAVVKYVKQTLFVKVIEGGEET